MKAIWKIWITYKRIHMLEMIILVAMTGEARCIAVLVRQKMTTWATVLMRVCSCIIE